MFIAKPGSSIASAARVRWGAVHSVSSQGRAQDSYMATYTYKPEVLTALAGHGLIPTRVTVPLQLRAALNDLYRYELRELRDRLARREFPRQEYAGRVIELRKRYPLMSLPVEHWTL
jgi:hypothetical protein